MHILYIGESGVTPRISLKALVSERAGKFEAFSCEGYGYYELQRRQWTTNPPLVATIASSDGASCRLQHHQK